MPFGERVGVAKRLEPMFITRSRWAEISLKYPGKVEGPSVRAKLFMSERDELADLLKLDRFPVRAVLLLEESIKERASQLIQRGVPA